MKKNVDFRYSKINGFELSKLKFLNKKSPFSRSTDSPAASNFTHTHDKFSSKRYYPFHEEFETEDQNNPSSSTKRKKYNNGQGIFVNLSCMKR